MALSSETPQWTSADPTARSFGLYLAGALTRSAGRTIRTAMIRVHCHRQIPKPAQPAKALLPNPIVTITLVVTRRSIPPSGGDGFTSVVLPRALPAVPLTAFGTGVLRR